MTRASTKGGATTAARRLLVLAGAVAGFWLVSWWVSAHAQAATHEVNPIGEVVAGVLGGQPPGGAAEAPSDGARSGVVARVAGGVQPVSRVVRSSARAVEPVSGVVHAAAPVVRAAVPIVEPVVGSVAPVVEPVSQAVRAVEPVSRVVHTALEPVVRTVAPVLEPVTQVIRSAAPVLDPVRTVVRPVGDSVGGLVEPVADLASPVTRPVGEIVDPVVQPIVAPAAEGSNPAGELPVLPARQAKVVPPHQETSPNARQAAAQPTGQNRTYDRPSPATEPFAATPRPARHPTASQPVRTPGKAPAPRSPAPPDAACGATSTIPPAFLTPDPGPRVTRAVVRSYGDFVPLWRACEPSTGPG